MARRESTGDSANNSRRVTSAQSHNAVTAVCAKSNDGMLHSLPMFDDTYLFLVGFLITPIIIILSLSIFITTYYLRCAIVDNEQFVQNPLQLSSRLQPLIERHATLAGMSSHLRSTPSSLCYHQQGLLASRKPVLNQYDGPRDGQQLEPTSTFHSSISHNISPYSVAGPSENSKESHRLSRIPNVIAREVACEAAKKKAKEHKEYKKRLLAEERARKRWLGGVAWGFDPTAGMLSSGRVNQADGGAFVTAGRSLQGMEGTDELDEVGRPTGRRWVSHDLWGIEQGGPGKEGKYGHGSLRDREPSLDVPVGTKPRSLSPWRAESGSPSQAKLM